MTHVCPGAVWPSISPISENRGDAAAPPIIERDELAEGQGDQQGQVEAEVQEPVQGDIGLPEPRAEVRHPRLARRLILSTKAEIDVHFPLHLNFRSWCAHCRAGKSILAQHRVLPADREKFGVTTHMDYSFMTAEEAEVDMQPTLVVYDDDKDSFWALGVEQKAVTEGIVKYVAGILGQSGYQGEKLTTKSDQEPSIFVLKKAVLGERIGESACLVFSGKEVGV